MIVRTLVTLVATASVSYTPTIAAPNSATAPRLDATRVIASAPAKASTTPSKAAATATPGDFTQWMEAGQRAMQRGDLKTAISSYGAAVKVKPNDAYARKCLGYALVAGGYPAQGVQQLELSMSLAVPSIADLCFAGSAYAQAGNYPNAIRKYQQALAADPNNVNTLIGMAEVEKKAGMNKEARAAAAKALPLAQDPALKRRAMNVLTDEPLPQQQPANQLPEEPHVINPG
ncbi:MAG: tetratricopeptide repeat protein [Candidatus Obscuribacterales bacterium]